MFLLIVDMAMKITIISTVILYLKVMMSNSSQVATQEH